MKKLIDAHIHLDHYNDEAIENIFKQSPFLETVISVSFNLDSSKRNLELSKQHPLIHPAFGFHPEQPLPGDRELADLFSWMEENKEQMVAIGEVGLSYYSRDGKRMEPYAELLEEFIKHAKKWDKPVVLHAIYEDAEVACDLLEKHSVKKAHFHWFKGNPERMISNGYFISFTPDVVYEPEIQELARIYPLEQMMVETDGPWRFEGPFTGQATMPSMMHDAVREIARIKNVEQAGVYEAMYRNTNGFYHMR